MVARVVDPDLGVVEVPEPSPALGGAALSKLGHELRGPLSGIISLTGIMSSKIARDVVDPAQQVRQLGMLTESAKGLLDLVERLIGLAHLENDDPEPQAERTDCRAIVAEVVADLGPSAAARERRLVVASPAEPVVAPAPASSVRTIVRELLDNAIKYGDTDDIDVRVGVSADTGRAWLEVRDHGPGLDAETQQLFQPFVRGSAAEVRDESGTGLGLCLAQRTVTRCGADFAVRTGPAGTLFTVTFAAPSDLSEDLADRSEP